MIPFAADVASGCVGACPGVMIVPALCALLYMHLEGFKFGLHILAKEMDPLWDCLGLVI